MEQKTICRAREFCENGSHKMKRGVQTQTAQTRQSKPEQPEPERSGPKQPSDEFFK